MPPVTGKRKSAEDDAYGVTTPTGSPPKKLRITRSQKQALIDNLQLEITERARKLRAQYALQASDLRARIERRVNRIPVSLRKVNMGELLEKHNTQARQGNISPPKRLAHTAKGSRNTTTISVDPDTLIPSTTSQSRLTRKQSHEGLYSDKENAPAAGEPVDALKNPKRRANGAGGTSRVASQKVRGEDSRILSPKSLNSRTYHQSPLRGSPEKLHNTGYLSRPISPLKPSSPLKATPANMADARARTTKGAASMKDNRPPSQLRTRAAGTGPRAIRSPASRPATRQHERRLSTSTNSSTASSGTTIVKSTRPATATGIRRPTTASSNPATKKTTVAKSQAPTAAAKRGAAATRKATPASAEAPTKRRALRTRA